MLPQEMFANAAWAENLYGVLSKKRLAELLHKCNLKCKKGKTLDDVYLAICRGYKDTYNHSEKERAKIAEEIDKVCVIERWDFAVAKYGYPEKEKEESGKERAAGTESLREEEEENIYG